MPNATFDRTAGFTIRLFPTEEQKNIFDEYFGVSRYIYNWAIDKEQEEYLNTGGFISAYSLFSDLSKIKETKDWMKKFDSTALKLRISDAINAYRKFFKKKVRHPRYKTKKDSAQMFCVRSDRLRIQESEIRIPSIGWIKCGKLPNPNIIGDHSQCSSDMPVRYYYDSRIHKSGDIYYISFTMDIDESPDIDFQSLNRYPRKIFADSESIGIDLGCKRKNWIVDSNGNKISLPDTDKEDKKIKHFQKVLARKFRSRTKNDYISNNANKVINTLNKYYRRKKNKRKAKLYDYISHEILSRNPSRVVIEDISVSELISHNNFESKKAKRRFNQNVFDSSFREIRDILEYKLRAHNIPLVIADKYYPSTKTCSNCGSKNIIGPSSVYSCPHCGMTMDRDLNASINLSKYDEQYSYS